MIELLGSPEIVGSAGTPDYFVDEYEREGVRSIAPRHCITYTVPVIKVLGRLRRVMPNGDLDEVDAGNVKPPLALWAEG
jgi:hypothetical protein